MTRKQQELLQIINRNGQTRNYIDQMRMEMYRLLVKHSKVDKDITPDIYKFNGTGYINELWVF